MGKKNKKKSSIRIDKKTRKEDSFTTQDGQKYVRNERGVYVAVGEPTGSKKTKKVSISGSRASVGYNNYRSGSSYGGYSYGGYGYNRSYGSGYGSYKPNYNNFDWNSWGWGGFGWNEDDDSDLVIKQPEGYVTPTASDVKDKMSFRLQHGGREAVQKNVEFVKNFSRYFYHEMMEDPDYISEEYTGELPEEKQAKLAEYEQYVEMLKDRDIPGHTPFEKAINFINILAEQRNSSDSVQQMLQEEEPGPLPSDEDYSDPELNDLLSMNDFTKKFKHNILNKMFMIKSLGGKFKIEKEVEEKPVVNSRLRKRQKMREFDQLKDVEMYQRMLPSFDVKFATKDLTVNIPVDRTEHMQKIIMLVDFSGSMYNHEKQQWVCALLLDRLRYAIKEECEIFFSFFLSDVSWMNFTHIYDKKTVHAFWRSFSTDPHGGDTRLGHMVNHLNTEINEHGRLHNLKVDISNDKVEILAINDGQDTVKTSNFAYKTNALSLMEENPELRQLCLKNKGKYVYIPYNSNGLSDIKTYE